MKPGEMRMGFSDSQQFETFSYLLYFIHLLILTFPPSLLSELYVGAGAQPGPSVGQRMLSWGGWMSPGGKPLPLGC